MPKASTEVQSRIIARAMGNTLVVPEEEAEICVRKEDRRLAIRFLIISRM